MWKKQGLGVAEVWTVLSWEGIGKKKAVLQSWMLWKNYGMIESWVIILAKVY